MTGGLGVFRCDRCQMPVMQTPDGFAHVHAADAAFCQLVNGRGRQHGDMWAALEAEKFGDDDAESS